MDAIIKLSYSEYAVIEELNRLLKKYGYSIYIPDNRRQKAVDLIINKDGTGKIARVQIKASRSYEGGKNSSQKYHLWFNNFEGRYKKGDVDFYILFGIYPQLDSKKVDSKDIWKHVFLCFNGEEMLKFLAGVKTKKESKRDRFFGFGFNSAEKIYTERYKTKGIDVSGFLLEKKTKELIAFLDKRS